MCRVRPSRRHVDRNTGGINRRTGHSVRVRRRGLPEASRALRGTRRLARAGQDAALSPDWRPTPIRIPLCRKHESTKGCEFRGEIRVRHGRLPLVLRENRHYCHDCLEEGGSPSRKGYDGRKQPSRDRRQRPRPAHLPRGRSVDVGGHSPLNPRRMRTTSSIPRNPTPEESP
jgi:hypothetical protein